ncbi:glycyl-tRNA synthetase [Kingella potus]|uniref:Glycyl-tRNA synthetase n=1 Tax=Kingella potus TaxID=265175 RepID=A0A377QYF2_9NEIS|nr:glycyl-tRNA synthetase [Kingella potus]
MLNLWCIYDKHTNPAHADRTFDLLGAHGVISVTECTTHTYCIRVLSRAAAYKFVESCKKLGFPLLKEKAA